MPLNSRHSPEASDQVEIFFKTTKPTMKNCPKCDSTKIMESVAFRPIEGQKLNLSLREPNDNEAWFNFSTSEPFEMFTIVCGECGY